MRNIHELNSGYVLMNIGVNPVAGPNFFSGNSRNSVIFYIIMNFKPKDKVVFNKDLFRSDGSAQTKEQQIPYVTNGLSGVILETFKNKIGGQEKPRWFAKVKTKDGIKTARITSINFAHES